MKRKKKRNVLRNKAVSKETHPRKTFNKTDIPWSVQIDLMLRHTLFIAFFAQSILFNTPEYKLQDIITGHKMCLTFE